jgi:hypothetical protein
MVDSSVLLHTYRSSNLPTSVLLVSMGLDPTYLEQR